MKSLHPDVKEVLLSEEDIRGIVSRMGEQITADYADKNPLVVAVLRGAVVFTADLMRAIDCPIGIDFMAVSSYGDGAKSSGVVRIVKDLTLSYLIDLLKGRGPASVEVAAFLVKDVAGKRPAIEPRYVGTHVPDEFIVGYGLDFAERYRNLPYIGVLKPEVYA